jgi:alanine racemase
MLSWIEIDAEALRSNYRTFEKLLGFSGLPAPVLKSNAYGHGLEQVYRALAPVNPSWICTNYIFEAQRLRDLGFQGRILICGPVTADQLDAAEKACCDIFIGHHEVALAARARSLQLHIEFDTGMSRQGFLPEAADSVAALFKGYEQKVAGLCMHFANVEDVYNHDYAHAQMQRFQTAVNAFKGKGFKPMLHSASSASTLILPQSRMDLQRIGISLYGFWPSQATRLSFGQGAVPDLKPALTWKTRVTSVIPVKSGQFIGYGCTWRANHDMSVAVLPVGYFEGYPRSASGSSSHVLLRGTRCQIVGRICMNMLMIDVTHLKDVAVGETATLIGTDGGETVTAGDVAGWCQTIHYEIVTRLHPEIPRRLV